MTTKSNIALAELAEKGADTDLLREMIQYVAQRMIRSCQLKTFTSRSTTCQTCLLTRSEGGSRRVQPVCGWLVRPLAIALACAGWAAVAKGSPLEFDNESIEGWPVHFEVRLVHNQPAAVGSARDELRARLAELKRLLPDERVRELRRIGIYLRATAESEAGHYTVSTGPNQFGIPSGSVDLGGVSGFLKSQHEVPSRVLHELAHGYHFQILGDTDKRIGAAYDHAVQTGLYQNVQNWQGRTVEKSYALTDRVEYFALATQAYFERSGFYPFTREQLRSYDPMGYELVREVWERRPGPQPDLSVSAAGRHASCESPLMLTGQPGSERGVEAAVLAIRNNTLDTLQIWWHADNGRREKYPDLPAAGLRLQRILSPHVWEIRSAGGSCILVVRAGPLGLHVTVEP
jgi:hypothetical protein